ncbi:hypothetical protein Pfo_020569 [Paulownia fortunei]|nr:hypothetical protein Pfo_020569 [Paulownia fortunei]
MCITTKIALIFYIHTDSASALWSLSLGPNLTQVVENFAHFIFLTAQHFIFLSLELPAFLLARFKTLEQKFSVFEDRFSSPFFCSHTNPIFNKDFGFLAVCCPFSWRNC